MAINNWWEGDPTERYWMEITDRSDLGVDLRAPKLDGSGKEFWSYTLTTFVRPGDRVFHWHKNSLNEPAIVGWSTASGPVETFDMTWQARGTRGRARGVAATGPAWRVPLLDFTELDPPVLRSALQARYDELLAILDDVAQQAAGTPYLPLQNYGGRELRAAQAYLAKFPAALVDALFGSAGEGVGPEKPKRPRSSRGQGFIANAALREAIETHAVRLAATHYRSLGATEIEERGKPYDLRVVLDGVERHVEVKGASGVNIEAVQVTQGEVDHAKRWSATDLYVVDGIAVAPQTEGGFEAQGGRVRWWRDWRPAHSALRPTQLRYTLPSTDPES